MSPEECIDKLEQLIIDENELVNYKILSKELKIHVNEAKKYLYDFLKIQNSKKDVKLHAYFFLSGVVVKNNAKTRKIVIVSEDNLEMVKKGFAEITSCHIYSLNKGVKKDDSLLFNSQSWCKKWAEEHREYSAIKHPNVMIQTPVIKRTETTKSISKPLPSKSAVVKQSNNKDASSLFKSENKTASPAKDKSSEKIVKTSNSKEEPIKPATTAKSETSEKKSMLSNLWQKLEDKSKNGKSESSKTDTKGKKGSAKTVGKNNIMSMFSKQAEKNANNPTKKSDTSSPAKQVSLPVENSTSKISPRTNNIVEDKKVTGKTTRKPSQRKAKRTSKQNSDNDSEEEIKPKKKKHKRICTMDDSDSDSETEEAKDKAQRSLLASEEPTDVAMNVSDDSEEPIPPTPPVASIKGKKKVWKTVQKTFQDEDGFLVAKQEKILVSASDSDEDPLPSKNNEPKKETKENSFTYRKQASLTSFFKQK